MPAGYSVRRGALDLIPGHSAQLATAQADIARKAFRRYGRGRHAANLNFGDCFAYALAKDTSAPLLFKGDDFGQTDVMVASY